MKIIYLNFGEADEIFSEVHQDALYKDSIEKIMKKNFHLPAEKFRKWRPDIPEKFIENFRKNLKL